MNWTYIIFILIITTTIIFLCIKKNKDEFTMKKITMDIWKDNINMLTTHTSRARICVVCYDNRKNDDITKLKSINTTYCKKMDMILNFMINIMMKTNTLSTG